MSSEKFKDADYYGDETTNHMTDINYFPIKLNGKCA